jgi:hypothetical protein
MDKVKRVLANRKEVGKPKTAPKIRFRLPWEWRVYLRGYPRASNRSAIEPVTKDSIDVVCEKALIGVGVA